MKVAAALSWRDALSAYLKEIAHLVKTMEDLVLKESSFHLQVFAKLRKSPSEIWKDLVIEARMSGDERLTALIDRIMRGGATGTSRQTANKPMPSDDTLSQTPNTTADPLQTFAGSALGGGAGVVVALAGPIPIGVVRANVGVIDAQGPPMLLELLAD